MGRTSRTNLLLKQLRRRVKFSILFLLPAVHYLIRSLQIYLCQMRGTYIWLKQFLPSLRKWTSTRALLQWMTTKVHVATVIGGTKTDRFTWDDIDCKNYSSAACDNCIKTLCVIFQLSKHLTNPPRYYLERPSYNSCPPSWRIPRWNDKHDERVTKTSTCLTALLHEKLKTNIPEVGPPPLLSIISWCLFSGEVCVCRYPILCPLKSFGKLLAM